MAAIQPNTDIFLIAGTRLTADYKHTIYFQNATAQYTFFQNHVLYALTLNTYQRTGLNRIRVQKTIAEVERCEYLMFRNTNYENKWFYAFIDDFPKYINDNTTEISYTIDVMQTWMFELGISDSFVERIHTPTDNPGEHRLAENLDCGEMVNALEIPIFNDLGYLGCIVSTKPLPNIFLNNAQVYPTDANGTTGMINLGSFDSLIDGTDANYPSIFSPKKSANITTGQVLNGLYVYSGFPLNLEDYNAKWANDTLYNSYHMSAYRWMYNANGAMSNYPITLSMLAYIFSGQWYDESQSIFNNKITYTTENHFYQPGGHTWTKYKFSADNIVAVFQYPADFSNKAAVNAGITQYGSNCAVIDGTLSPPTAFEGWTPKNKKCLCYPYNYIELTDMLGNNKVLLYENSTGNTGSLLYDTIHFQMLGVIGSLPLMVVYPTNYNRQTKNYENSISYSHYPICNFVVNEYQNWLNQNRQQLLFNILGCVIGAGASVAGLAGIGSKIITDYGNNTWTSTGTKGTMTYTTEHEDLDTGEVFHSRRTQSVEGHQMVTPYWDTFHKQSPNHNKMTNSGSEISTKKIDPVGAAQSLYNIGDSLAKMDDKNGVANSMVGALNTDAMTAVKCGTIIAHYKQCKLFYIQRIDNFFTHFGYRVDTFTVPSLKNRKYWTFIKTRDIHCYSANGAIPRADLIQIEDNFNNGITFWTLDTDNGVPVLIGDYNHINSTL